MSTTLEPMLRSSGPEASVGDTVFDPNVYRCHLALLKEEEGGVSILVLNLPGCGSCGDTEEDAIENVKEAVVGVIESYKEDSVEIPWITEYHIPSDARTKWILVNA